MKRTLARDGAINRDERQLRIPESSQERERERDMKQKEDEGVGVRKRIEKPDSKRAGGKSVESVEEIGFGLTRKDRRN